MEQGPIFIGGLDRTGKTLMRLALSRIPHVIITKRSDLWTRYFNRFGDLSEPINLESCLNAIMAYKHIQALKPDLNRIMQEFRNGAPTYARLFSLFHEQLAEREHKLRWGDQSELIEGFADPILKAYPDAKFIHMIRDPRDRYSASKQKWSTGKGKTGFATAKWMHSARLAHRNTRKYPDRYKVVRYEDLVSQPERCLEEICSFLKEEFQPSMLLIGHLGGNREEIALPDHLQDNHFLKRFVGEYKFNLSKYEIDFIQRTSPSLMQVYNYHPIPLQFSVGELAQYWGKHLPRNLSAFFYWFATQANHQSPSASTTQKKSRVSPGNTKVHRSEKVGEIHYE